MQGMQEAMAGMCLRHVVGCVKSPVRGGKGRAMCESAACVCEGSRQGEGRQGGVIERRDEAGQGK